MKSDARLLYDVEEKFGFSIFLPISNIWNKDIIWNECSKENGIEAVAEKDRYEQFLESKEYSEIKQLDTEIQNKNREIIEIQNKMKFILEKAFDSCNIQ